MAMYADAALSGGGASTFGTGPPPLALYDLIGQKDSPVSYAYSCDMSAVGEEADAGEEDEKAREEGNSTHYTSGPPPPPQRHPSRGRDDAHEQQQPNDAPTRPTSYTQPPPSPPPPTTDHTRPPISQSQTFPQPSPKRPTDWQTIRYMTVPGRAHKAQLEAWVGGWSESVGELGEETYCACADSTAATTESSSTPPLTREASRADVDSKLKGGLQQPQHEEQKETEMGGRKGPGPGPGVSFTCRNCSRQPSPALIPDQDLVFPPASGAGRVAMKCKLVWKRIVGRTVRGKSVSPADARGRGSGQGQPANGAHTPNLSQTADKGGGYDVDEDEDEDADDEEVDIDKLSLSSKERRAGDDIADRQARLRRAQRLLRKEGRNGVRAAG
ncbi:hypothetical protein GE09DRAFT_1226626 [Coniochaeta sp. 2T2.1]|nr:hypothetical protein GE09DRAFT_1226626 [Coniochaeta sp. 2T2.1]